MNELQDRSKLVAAVARAAPEASPYAYDAFATYATDPDRDIVRALEAFIESFHLRPSLPDAMRHELELCLDGRDFIIPRRLRDNARDPQAISDIVEAYMRRSRALLVLCGPLSRDHRWINHEVRWWLTNRPADPIYFALTHGSSNREEDIMPPALLDAGGGDLAIYFDLRGFYQQRLWHRPWASERATELRRGIVDWQNVRPFPEEAVKIVARLLSDALGGSFSVNDIQSAFEEDQRRNARRRRLAAGIAALGVMGFVGAGGWLVDARMKADREASMEAQLQRSRVLADQGGAALPAALAYAASAFAAGSGGPAAAAAFTAMQELAPIERILRPDGGEPAWTAGFVADDHFILVGGRSGILRLVDTASGEVKARIDLNASGIRQIVASSASNNIFVGTDKGLFRLALRSDVTPPTLEVTGHDLAFDRVGGLVIDSVRGRVLAGLLHSGEIWSFPVAGTAAWTGTRQTTVMDPRFAEEGTSEVQSGIYGLGLSNDHLVATGIDGVVSIFQADHLQAAPRQFIHPHSIFAMDVSRRSDELAVADDDGGMSVYDIASATLRRAVSGVSTSASVGRTVDGKLAQSAPDRLPNVGLAISPDDEIVAVTSHDRTVRFLTFATLSPLGLAVHRAAPRTVVFGHAGQAVTVADDGALQIVRPTAQPEVARVANVESFVALGDGRIVTWAPRPPAEAGFNQEPISPPQRPLVLLDPGFGTVSRLGDAEGDLWNAVRLDRGEFAYRDAASSVIHIASSSGTPRCGVLNGHNEPGEIDIVQDMMAGPDAGTLASVTMRNGSDARVLHIWDLVQCAIRKSWPTSGPAAAMAGAVATVDGGRRVQMHIGSSGPPVTLGFAHPVTAISIGDKGRSVLAVLGDARAVCLCWSGRPSGRSDACRTDSQSYECRSVGALLDGPNGPETPSRIHLSPSGAAAIVQHRSAVQLAATAGSDWVFRQVAPPQLRQVTPPFAFDAEEQRVAVAAGETGVRLVEAATGRVLAEFPTNSRVMKIAFTAGTTPYLATLDGTMLRVWDWRPETIRARICERWNPEIDVGDGDAAPPVLTHAAFCDGHVP